MGSSDIERAFFQCRPRSTRLGASPTNVLPMDEWDKETSIRVTKARRAIERGEVKLAVEMEGLDELLRAPLTPLGLVDISQLSPAAIRLGRIAGGAMGALAQMVPSQTEAQGAAIDPQDA